jgi:hypothetical protein
VQDEIRIRCEPKGIRMGNEPLSEALLNFYTFPPIAVIFSPLKEKREGHLEELYSSSCT